MRKAAAIGLLALMLTGCETTAVHPDHAKQVPLTDVHAFGKQRSLDDARIVFTQDSGAISCFGAGMSVYLDGILAAETSQGRSVELFHAPGPTQLSIKNNAKCAGGGLAGLLLDLKPGYSYQVRGYRDMWDKPSPMLSEPTPYRYTK